MYNFNKISIFKFLKFKDPRKKQIFYIFYENFKSMMKIVIEIQISLCWRYF